MIALLLRFVPTYWRPLALLLAAVALTYTGWHARGVVGQANQAEELRRAAEQRRKQEEQARLQDASNEAQATQQRQVTDDRTRKAYEKATLPDRQLLLGNDILLELDAAADSPAR